VTLVDIHGRPIVADDQGDAASWPAWTDNHYWEVADDERAALEAAEVERIRDVLDAPPLSRPSFSQWLDSQGGIAWEEGGPDDPFARAEAKEEYYRTHYSS
jgi:hypothetical protein